LRVLFDENIPHDLIGTLVDHTVVIVQGLGWAGIENGALLQRATGLVNAFVTMDRKLESEHDLTALPFGVVVIRARSNRIADLLPLVDDIRAALAHLGPGTIVRVGPPGPPAG
jgi:hypothetical protein